MGFFHVVEYIPRKFIVTSLSISRRPPKERICFPAGKSFLSEQIIGVGGFRILGGGGARVRIWGGGGGQGGQIPSRHMTS